MNNKKKIVIAIFTIIVITVLSNLSVVTAKAEQNEEFEYLVNNGEVSIVKYIGHNKNVIIPSTIKNIVVTEILNDAFNDKKEIITIQIPTTVTKIMPKAFYLCSNIDEINVEGNNSVYSSEEGVLYSKDKTILVTFPEGKGTVNMLESVVEIGSYAFADCGKLESVQFPEGLKTIGEGAFENCTHLYRVKIPEGVISIGAGAFENCSYLFDVNFPKGLKSINEGTFSTTSLSNVEIPNGVTSIGANAFKGCTKLGSIKIPDSVTSIDSGAFLFTYLDSIEIPSSVTYIGEYVFNMHIVIYGEKGSYAESYAQNEKNIKFKANGQIDNIKRLLLYLVAILFIISSIKLYFHWKSRIRNKK